ncbi:MAG: M20 family metallopeptidase, partial [Erysipelotrichia bacterium]|nr:M20 family metallopeptidase [Erysipelotrichia bacterium]
VTKALQFVEALAKKDGFIVTNYNNMVVEILTNDLKPNITIMAHADIVPVGTGWPQDPLTVFEKDGTLYGRGVADDKGPLLAAYYALKALRDNGLLGEYQVRFLVGGNEERGSACMTYDLQHLNIKQPTFGFSPDSQFPLTYAEKGIIGFKVTKDIDFSDLLSIKGGVASNSVIEKCEVTLKTNLEFVSYLDKQRVDYCYLANDETMVLTFHGLAAHGSMPWEGTNAAMIAIKHLGQFFKQEDFKLLYERYAPLRGEGLKADATSENMGTNSLNVGLLNFSKGRLEMIVNYRHVETVTSEDMIEKIVANSHPFNAEVLGISPLLFYPKDSVLVTTLLDVYQKETRDYVTPIIASGGGTYAKEADNTVAFGMNFANYDSRMHGVNESIRVEHLEKATSIYAHAIIALGKKI